jgi:glycine/D-amino acid oxidase-like deaminating enzyme
MTAHNHNHQPQVIVVGAGIAGLAAAFTLQRAGLRACTESAYQPSSYSFEGTYVPISVTFSLREKDLSTPRIRFLPSP